MHQTVKHWLARAVGVFLVTSVGSGCVFLMDIGKDPREVWTAPNDGSGPEREYGVGYTKSVGVVIGIDDYEHWSDLEGGVDDAERMRDVLETNGFDEIFELKDGDASRRAILNLLHNELPERVAADDRVVIYFAGHGQTQTFANGARRGYILPADADDDLIGSAISMVQLRDVALELESKHVLYVMDSCYSGTGFTRGVGMREKKLKFDPTTRLAVQMITAGMEGELAHEKDGQGLFTTHLIGALKGGADADHDGYVTLVELGQFVQSRVEAETQQTQSPQFGTLEGKGELRFEVPGGGRE